MPTYNPGAGFRRSSRWNPARKHPTTGKVEPHRGEDWAAPIGTPIPAAADGEVVFTGWVAGYGNVVVLEHQINGDTVHTLYAHMHDPSPLKKETTVKARDTVGKVGSTGGRSSGPHLHFEVMPGGKPGQPNLRKGHPTVDPATYDFPEAGGDEAPAEASSGGGAGPWSFPFKGRGTGRDTVESDYLGTPIGSEGALSRVFSGYYPIGANSLWHGGIHFDPNSDALLDQKGGVRCIRDGEVVAYFIDTTYREIEFPGGNKAAYSSSFTLIRHRLEIPAEDPAQRKALVFYSLYMHLLDWQGYKDEPRRARPPFWGAANRFSVGEKAKDRQTASSTAPVVAEFEGSCGGGDAFEEFKRHLRLREGYREDVYKDSRGLPTVGTGHLVRPEDNLKLGDVISAARADELLTQDSQKAWNAAQSQAADAGITDEAFIVALGSVNFQLGTGWRSKFPNTWGMIKNGQYLEAEAALNGTLWQKQTPVRVADFQKALRDLAAGNAPPACNEQGAGHEQAPTPAPAAEVVGLNIRKEATSRSAKLGLLPRGARIEVGARSADRKWGQISKVLEGEIAPTKAGAPVDPAAATGWVFLPELDAVVGEPEALDSLVVLATPKPIKAGELVGHIGEYQQYEDARPATTRDWRMLLHLEVFSADDVPAFVAQCRSYAQSLPPGSGTRLLVEQGAKPVRPSDPDVTLEPGTQVRPEAGSKGPWVKVRRVSTKVVERAQLGTFSSANNTYSKGETWTGWFVGASDTERTRDEAEAKQKGYTRREVQVPTGEPLWVRSEDAEASASGQALRGWSAFPLQLRNANAPEVALSYVASRAELERGDPRNQVVDPEGNRWYRLSLPAAGADPGDQRPGEGWVCEKGHAKVSWRSPWAWPGFEFVKEGQIQPADLLARSLDRAHLAEDREEKDFKARADRIEGSALVTKIHEHIDRNRDGTLDAQELQNAVKVPVLLQALSRLIVHYESEWGGEMTKWNELDPLMLDGLPEWQVEKLRIDALRWWPKAAEKIEGFPADPNVYHIHPIALIGNFMGASSGKCANCEAAITVAQLKQLFPQAPDAKINATLAVFNEAYKKFDLVKCRRKAHFFAQVMEEVGATIQAKKENMNYSPQGLKDTFSYFRKNPAEATRYGRTSAHPADQEAIANRAYGNRNGNGSIASGDGWKFRGKGYLQLTGRGNYEAAQREITRRFPDSGVDIVGDEDAILTPKGGMIAAMAFWTMNKLNDVADKGEADENVNAVTAIVNKHTKSYKERRENFHRAKEVFKLSECTDK